jgi:3-oxoacyl-[acyl-carrier-protein] synthase-1
VAAVDSLVQQNLTEYYLDQRRMLTPRNSNGFSPGEAGSAVLVSSVVGSPAGELQILGTGMGQENATIGLEEPLRGDGLTQAIGEAFRDAEVRIEDVHYRITDLNGEHYKFKEMIVAMMRYERKPKPKLFDLWHPIEYIGDVGAAIGPIVLGVALHAGQKSYGVGPTVLCTFGNDNGERAAIVVHFQTRDNRP